MRDRPSGGPGDPHAARPTGGDRRPPVEVERLGPPGGLGAPADALETCFAIRTEVFVDEQRVPESEEIDGLEHESVHFLARVEGRAVGTARMRLVGDDAKAERVAVRAAARELGVGRALMEAIEAEARRRHCSRLRLHAQVRVIPFYERLGYRAEGEVFEEAGIPHRRMHKPLGPG